MVFLITFSIFGNNGVCRWVTEVPFIQGKCHMSSANPRRIAVGETGASKDKQLNTSEGLVKMKI